MGKSRAIVENHQRAAAEKLTQRETELKTKKVDPKSFRRDPAWRELNAVTKKIKKQLIAIEKYENLVVVKEPMTKDEKREDKRAKKAKRAEDAEAAAIVAAAPKEKKVKKKKADA